MMIHPDLTMTQVRAHQHELIAEAERHRLRVAARQRRRVKPGKRQRHAHARDDRGTLSGGIAVPAGSCADGTLSACGSGVAAPASR